jgi:hypothetical protein
MLYKDIDPSKLALEYACPFCLSAKFNDAEKICEHVGRCQGAQAVFTAAELADPLRLQLGGSADADADAGITMADYITEEEIYYKNMQYFAQGAHLQSLTDRSADELLACIIDHLKTGAATAPIKNMETAAWRLMTSFFTLDDATMERYLQIIYGTEDVEELSTSTALVSAPERKLPLQPSSSIPDTRGSVP